jgi:hypothetical protein
LHFARDQFGVGWPAFEDQDAVRFIHICTHIFRALYLAHSRDRKRRAKKSPLLGLSIVENGPDRI